jgi:hypothetical protein
MDMSPDSFVLMFWDFYLPPSDECLVSCGCSRLDERGSIYLVDVRGEEVLASTLDRSRLWRRGPLWPGDSELSWEVWDWGLVGDILILLCCCSIGNPSRFLFSFLPSDVIGHLKLHAVGDVDLCHSLGIDFGWGYETEYDNNTDGWYDWGMRRFGQGCLWREEKKTETLLRC